MKAVTVGGNFAGFTWALDFKRKTGPDVQIAVIDRSPYFVSTPSLIWVPFKTRNTGDIQIWKDVISKRKGILFIQAEAVKVDPINQVVSTSKGDVSYSRLVITSGPKSPSISRLTWKNAPII